MEQHKKYYTYILHCADGTLYTGYTDNIEKRLEKHNQGLGAKYTRGRLPVIIAYAACCQTRSEALSLEAKIKQLSRAEKLQLIDSWDGTVKPIPD